MVLEKISPSKYKIRMNTSQEIQIVHIGNVITRKQLQPGEENNTIQGNANVKTRRKNK